jgi:hypothetical protein
MQNIFRTTEVTVLEQKVKIGELSVDQVDDMILSRGEETEGEVRTELKGNAHFVKERMAPVVAASLRNADEGNADWYVKGKMDWDDIAVPSAPGSVARKVWNPARASRLGFPMVTGLYEEISKYSGLRTIKVEEEKSIPGEGQAAERVM